MAKNYPILSNKMHKKSLPKERTIAFLLSYSKSFKIMSTSNMQVEVSLN